MTVRQVTLAMMMAASMAMPALAAKTHGLIIGINSYPHIVSLDGAVNDARDIAGALKESGVSNVVLLTDEKASHAAVTKAWKRMLAKAEAGDTIVFSFAGHGAQFRQAEGEKEVDGRDEFFVLSGFDPKRLDETFGESIFDNELFGWFEAARQKRVKVVFVADSCHSGGMARAVTGKMRYVALDRGTTLRSVPGASGKGNRIASGVQDNVTMLAATVEGKPIPEVIINRKPRGALSYAFARAVEGYADKNGDGELNRSELEAYLLSSVRSRSDALQEPVFTPLAADGTIGLIRVAPTKVAMKSLMAQRANKEETHYIPVADLGWQPVLPLAVLGTSYQPANTIIAEQPYVWNAITRQFRNPNGEKVAEDVGKFTVNDVVDKFILLDFLAKMQEQNPGKIDVSPVKSLYLAGDRFKFGMWSDDYKHALVFNLANSGEVQFLDMAVDGKRTETSWISEIKVVEPYGADHLVAIASTQSLEAIGQAIKKGVPPKDLLTMIKTRLDGTDTSVMVQPIFTKEK